MRLVRLYHSTVSACQNDVLNSFYCQLKNNQLLVLSAEEKEKLVKLAFARCTAVSLSFLLPSPPAFLSSLHRVSLHSPGWSPALFPHASPRIIVLGTTPVSCKVSQDSRNQHYFFVQKRKKKIKRHLNICLLAMQLSIGEHLCIAESCHVLSQVRWSFHHSVFLLLVL